MLIDLREATRVFYRYRGQSTAAILSVGFSVGAAAAIAAAAHVLLVQPPPGVHATNLRRVLFKEAGPAAGLALPATTSYPIFRDLTQAFEGDVRIAAYAVTDASIRINGSAEIGRVTFISPSFFNALGASLLTGRGFRNPNVADAEVGAVISEEFWRSHLGGGSEAIGRAIEINGKSARVIGILKAPFRGVDLVPSDLWIALNNEPQLGSFSLESKKSKWLHVVARIDDRRRAAFENRATTILRRSTKTDSTAAVRTERLTLALRPRSVSADVLAWIGLAVVLLLTVGSVNTASLTLAQLLTLRDSYRLRVALGATRFALWRRASAEIGLVVLPGGALGLLIARWIVALIGRLGAVGDQEHLMRSEMLWIVCFALGLVTIACLLLPSIHLSRLFSGENVEMRGMSQSASRLQLACCIVQVGLLMPATILALQAAKGFRSNVMNDLGMSLDNVAAVSLGPSASALSDQTEQRTLEAIRVRASRIPGVRNTSRASFAPFAGTVLMGAAPNSGRGMFVSLVVSDSEYFDVVGLRLTRGRLFGHATGQPAPRVAVVDAAIARTFWPNQDPIGECLHLSNSDASDCDKVVGVVESLSPSATGEPVPPTVYLPASTLPNALGVVLVRADPGSPHLVRLLKSSLAGIAPDASALVVTEATAPLEPRRRPWRLGLAMFAGATAICLFLAAFGIYSTTTLFGRSQRRELGIRSALGSSRSALVWHVLVRALAGAAIGLGSGAMLTFLLMNVLRSTLAGIEAPTALQIVITISCLTAFATLAALKPAFAETRVNPLDAFRGT